MGPKTKPLDTSSQTLPKELDPLVEALAQHRTMRRRGKAGAAQEKGRDFTIELLEQILALGYRIEAPVAEVTFVDHSSGYDSTPEILKRLKSREELKLADLISVWEPLSQKHWTGSTEVYELLGNRILKAGEPILAYDVVARGLQRWPTSVRLKQLMALALARSGATPRANQILWELYQEGHRDGETLGILARTHKDLAEQAESAPERTKELRRARGIYLEAYQLALREERLDDAIYTGINAASTALLTDAEEDAREIARKVGQLCRIRLNAGDDYWAMASLGEAAIILGEWGEAEEWYGKAAQNGRGNFGDLSSTRRQARLVMDFIGLDRNRFDHCFGIPKVVLFDSSPWDRLGHPHVPFSKPSENALRRRIADGLAQFPDKIGYCGAGSGCDILFIEEMERQGGEINIVLPFSREIFEKAVVNVMFGTQWLKRFQKALKKVTSVVAASVHPVSANQVIDEYSKLMRNGLGVLRAQMLDTELHPLIVVDGSEGDGALQGYDAVDRWRAQGMEPQVIDVAELTREKLSVRATRDNGFAVRSGKAHAGSLVSEFHQQIVALLVADVKGFSSLTEAEFPRFAKGFLGLVAELLARFPRVPLVKNTWGDALHFVFSCVADAGEFALELQESLCSSDWHERISPEELNLRIALHAGPVFTWTDPVIERVSATGWHVVRAARIEPITPPGLVYASQAFAALAAAEGIREFVCDYVGEISMAKEFGTYPTYHVRRRHA